MARENDFPCMWGPISIWTPEKEYILIMNKLIVDVICDNLTFGLNSNIFQMKTVILVIKLIFLTVGDPSGPVGAGPLGTLGNPWGSLRGPLGTHGDPWGPLRTFGDRGP